MSQGKDIRQFLSNLRARGYGIVQAKRNSHWKIYWGERYITSTSATPRGGKRSLDNFKADIARFERGRDVASGAGERVSGGELCVVHGVRSP